MLLNAGISAVRLDIPRFWGSFGMAYLQQDVAVYIVMRRPKIASALHFFQL